MVSSDAASAHASSQLRAAVVAALISASLAVGACSADVSRFDSPLFALGDSGSSAPPRPAAGLGRSGSLSEQSPDSGVAGGSSLPPRSSAGSSQVASLPEPISPAPVAPVTKTRPVATTPSAAPQRKQAPIAAGQTIEVQQGDTLYGISRRYHVSVAELSALNGLQNPTIRPGQKLVLPASAKKAVPRAPAETAAAPVASKTADAGASAAPVVADAAGTYTVRPGDTVYKIARANKMSVADLMAANNLTNARQLKVGSQLRLSAAPATTTAPARVPAQAAEAVAPADAGAVAKVTIVNKRVASAAETTAGPAPQGAGETSTAIAAPIKPAEVQAAPIKTAEVQPAAASGTIGKFRWPVQGRVQSKFGPRADGSNNDGLDIIVPLGTDVLAAEAGEVVYTGDGIPSFGNLVLLRHANGYVTAYAHTDKVLVRRGEKVRRGQTIAKAGKTGQVDQPMLHFEVRQGQTPVDPMPLMEKL